MIRRKPEGMASSWGAPTGQPRAGWSGSSTASPVGEQMRSRRLIARLVVTLLVGGFAVLGLGSSAAAHAGLESSYPADGQVLPDAPRQVTLTFREPVKAGENAVRVFDDRMRRVDRGSLTDSAGEQVLTMPLAGALPDGTYTVAWRVESDDTHQSSGSLRFSIGAPSTVSGAIPPLGGSSESSAATTAILGGLRGVSYVGLALGPGILLVVLALWPAGLRDSRARRLMWSGVAALGLSTLGVVLLQAVWVNGLSLKDTWAGGAGLDNQFDAVLGARFYLLLAFGVLLAVATTTRRRRPLLAVAVLMTGSLLVTWPLTGHAAGRWEPLAVAVDLAHLAAMTVWLGGLALLAVSLSRASQARELATILPGFSRLAFGSVLVLVVTGTFQAWRQLGTFGALFGSPFGRLLLVKLGCVAVLVSLGGLARRWVHRRLTPAIASVRAVGGGDTLLLDRSPQPDGEQVRVLRRGLVAEVLMGAVVLGLTAVLVASVSVAPPAANQRAAQTSPGAPGATKVPVYPAASRPRAPDIGGETLDGAQLALADLRGKVVVVNVWGSWCQPCRKEAPDLARAARETAPRGVRFVGVVTRDNPAAAHAFGRSFNIPYPSLIDDDGQLMLEFAGVIPASAVPSTVVIDRKGDIAARVIGIVTYGALRGLIDDVLAETPPPRPARSPGPGS